MVESVDLGEQANPAIGLRGIRIMMEKEELFLPQFRAILRASALGNVSIMFPDGYIHGGSGSGKSPA